MVKLNEYRQFSGRHWETGSVCNYYAYRDVRAPHSGQPYSEALLLGISGGIVMGYFSFAYEGYDPHVALLTRNTFSPLDTLLERLGVEQEILQTSLPDKGRENLVRTLESGLPALTWVDIFSLPYLELSNDDDMYLMMPVVVYGYDEPHGSAWVADRSRAPLNISTHTLDNARGRVKKSKYRLLTLGDPDPRKLAQAVRQGIWDTIRLFTEPPPKGSQNNFGFKAYDYWQDLLGNDRHKSSWAKVFPPGRKMMAGLISAFAGTIQNGEDDGAERGTYASFIEEASLILNQPDLVHTAGLFRESARAWKELGEALLPDTVPVLGEVRKLLLKRRELFYHKGGDAVEEIAEINASIRAAKRLAETDFPLNREAELKNFLDEVRQHIQVVQDVEREAIESLQRSIRPL